MQNHWLVSSNNIYFCKCQKTDEEKNKEDEQTLEELNSAHRSSQNVSYYKPVTLKESNCSGFCHIISILLTELSRSVWENPDLGRVYKILSYRSPALLIRPKYKTAEYFDSFGTTKVLFHFLKIQTKK